MNKLMVKLKIAADMLDLSPRKFNQYVRPHLKETQIGEQGVYFRVQDLEKFVDRKFEAASCKDFTEEKTAKSGTSTSNTSVRASQAVPTLKITKRQRGT